MWKVSMIQKRHLIVMASACILIFSTFITWAEGTSKSMSVKYPDVWVRYGDFPGLPYSVERWTKKGKSIQYNKQDVLFFYISKIDSKVNHYIAGKTVGGRFFFSGKTIKGSLKHKVGIDHCYKKNQKECDLIFSDGSRLRLKKLDMPINSFEQEKFKFNARAILDDGSKIDQKSTAFTILIPTPLASDTVSQDCSEMGINGFNTYFEMSNYDGTVLWSNYVFIKPDRPLIQYPRGESEIWLEVEAVSDGYWGSDSFFLLNDKETMLVRGASATIRLNVKTGAMGKKISE